MPEADYTERQKRISMMTVAMIGGIFALTVVVFTFLFGAGTFLGGS